MDIARPVSNLIREYSFTLNVELEMTFKNLKKALSSAPVLAILKMGSPFTVTADASRFAVGAALDGRGHPEAFLSQRLADVENHWHTGDQELLAFLIAPQKWDVHLRGFTF